MTGFWDKFVEHDAEVARKQSDAGLELRLHRYNGVRGTQWQAQVVLEWPTWPEQTLTSAIGDTPEAAVAFAMQVLS